MRRLLAAALFISLPAHAADTQIGTTGHLAQMCGIETRPLGEPASRHRVSLTTSNLALGADPLPLSCQHSRFKCPITVGVRVARDARVCREISRSIGCYCGANRSGAVVRGSHPAVP